MVLLWHYVGCQINATATPELMWLRQIVSLMWSGVDLFFVLSGFLITGILRDHRDSDRYWSTFYVRRACRILPLYLLLLGSYGIALASGFAERAGTGWLMAGPMPFLSYATFTQNIFMGLAHGTGCNWMGVSWSLAVEEQFYLVLPLVVYFLPSRGLVWFLGAAVITAPVLRAAFPGYGALVNTPCKADALCLGGLIALLVREPAMLAAVAARARWLWTALGVLGSAAVGMTFQAGPFKGVDLQLGSFSAVSLLMLAVLYSVLLLLILTRPDAPPFRPLAWPALQWLGHVSYAVYLFHQLISGAFHLALRAGVPLLESWGAAIVTCLALVVTLVLAEISRRFLEGPILRWGHKFTYR